MALTEHQLHHLNAVKNEIADMRRGSKGKREGLLRNRGVKDADFESHMMEVEKDVSDIKKASIFPAGMTKDFFIHDFLEKGQRSDG